MKINYNGMPISFPEGTSQEDANAWIANNKDVADAELAKYNAKNELVTDKADTLLNDITNASGNVQSDIPSGYLGDKQSEKEESKGFFKEVGKGTATAASNIWDTLVDGSVLRNATPFNYTLDEDGNLKTKGEQQDNPLKLSKETKEAIAPETTGGKVLSEILPYFTPGGVKTVATNAPRAVGGLFTRALTGTKNRLATNAAQSITGVAVNNDTSTEEGRRKALQDLAFDSTTGAVVGKVGDVAVDKISPIIKGTADKFTTIKDKIKASTPQEKQLIQEDYEAGKLARKYGNEIKDDVVETVNKNSHNYPDGDGVLSRILSPDDKPILNPSQVFNSDNKFVKSEKRAVATGTGEKYKTKFEEQVKGDAIKKVNEESAIMHPFSKRPDGSQYRARPLENILEDINKLPAKSKGRNKDKEILNREINSGNFKSPRAIQAAGNILKANPNSKYLSDEFATRGSIEVRSDAIDRAISSGKVNINTYEREINKSKDSFKVLSDAETGNKPFNTQKQVGQEIEDSLRVLAGSKEVKGDSKVRDFITSAIPALGLTSAFTGETGFGPLDALIGYGAYAGKRKFNKVRDSRNFKKSEDVISKLIRDKDTGRDGTVSHLSDKILDFKSGNVNNTYNPNAQSFVRGVDTVSNRFVSDSSTAARALNTNNYPQAPQEASQEVYDYIEPTPQPTQETQPQSVSETPTASNIDEGGQIVVDAIIKAETGGLEDPFVFTGGKDPNSTDHSSAYGPGQITRGLAKDYLDRKSDLFTPDQLEYLELMVEQGDIMLNNARNGVKGTDLSYGGKGLLGQTPRDRQLYKEVMGVMIQDKLKENNGNLDATLKSWRGVDSNKDTRWYNVVYSELDKNL